jgi:pSer/pThr/pTyr-binding forkhead associated (FHA) protein
LAKASGDTTSLVAALPETFAYEDLGADDVAAIDELPAGSGMLLAIRGDQVGARYLINQDVTTAGRHPKCDIFLDDFTVSRRHARFLRHDGRIWIVDEGSLNGTYVNQNVIESEVELQRGDSVQIGKFRMVFFEAPQS